MLVAGINVDRGFTPEEMVEMYGSGKIKALAQAGYVGQASIDTGCVHFVPFQESTFFRSDPVSLQEGKATDLTNPLIVPHPSTLDEKRAELEAKHPMFRTTPQQKVARMTLRLMGEVKRTGRISGMPDEDVKAIVGESWKQGEPLSGEAVRRVAAHFLGLGERENREADRKRSTRLHPLA